MSTLKKEVEYIIYGKEDHSISRVPNVIDFWRRRLEFLDRHLDIARDSEGEIIFDGESAKSVGSAAAVFSR